MYKKNFGRFTNFQTLIDSIFKGFNAQNALDAVKIAHVSYFVYFTHLCTFNP